MSHWRLHPLTRTVVIALVGLIAVYLLVTFVYRGSRPLPPAVVVQPEQSPPQAETPPAETPTAGSPQQATPGSSGSGQ
jgi:hypothetical protein